VGDFLAGYIEPHTGLPAPSHDLWEERYGIHAFTVGTVWSGLEASARFAQLFGEEDRADRYRAVAERIRGATIRHMWSEEAQSYVRMVSVRKDGVVEQHHVPDSSIYGLIRFGMIAPDDPRAVATMQSLRAHLTCKTSIGGVARYFNDYYYQISQDTATIPGNPWFICTLWMAEYDVMRAQTLEDLAMVRDTLEWVHARALPSGSLAEQVHPLTGAPLSVSPLTWSHATLVGVVDRYLTKRRELLAEAEERLRRRVFES
jgi:GH15 family glucan-1,4-alpha-glucosidase